MRRLGLLILSLIVSLSPGVSRGGGYPDRPIRLVVGFGVGGPTDIPARFVADKLSEALGQRVFVENKPASGGIVATRDVIARPADGYTLLLCTHFEPINLAAYKDPGFKLSDLAPISLIAKYYYGLALSNAIPPTDVRSSPTPRRIPARQTMARWGLARLRKFWRASWKRSPASR